MQPDLFRPDEDLEMHWEVIEARFVESWNEQNRRFDKFPIYVHTRPKKWPPIEKCTCEVAPWEDCCETCPTAIR